jgi:hypothetical protein
MENQIYSLNLKTIEKNEGKKIPLGNVSLSKKTFSISNLHSDALYSIKENITQERRNSNFGIGDTNKLSKIEKYEISSNKLKESKHKQTQLELQRIYKKIRNPSFNNSAKNSPKAENSMNTNLPPLKLPEIQKSRNCTTLSPQVMNVGKTSTFTNVSKGSKRSKVSKAASNHSITHSPNKISTSQSKLNQLYLNTTGTLIYSLFKLH